MNAEEARQLTESSKRINVDLKKIDAKITEAAKKGYTSISISEYNDDNIFINQELEQALKSEGFEVREHCQEYTGCDHTISWEKKETPAKK